MNRQADKNEQQREQDHSQRQVQREAIGADVDPLLQSRLHHEPADPPLQRPQHEQTEQLRRHPPRQHALDPEPGERQREDDDDVAAFHVDDTRAARGVGIHALELLERAVRLEDGVQVPDEQYLRPRPAVPGDQVAAAAPEGAIDPFGLEAEGVELRPEHVADTPDAGRVERAAVDVDDALEQADRLVGVGVDVRRDGPFGFSEGHLGLWPIRAGRRGDREDRGQDSDGTPL